MVEVDADQLRALSNVFAAPKWLRDLGLASWFLAGAAFVIVGLMFLASLTATITEPVIVGMVVATVAAPLVSRLGRHMPRSVGAVIVLLLIVAVAVFVLVLVIGGITSQSADIKAQLDEALPKIQNWLTGLGVSSAVHKARPTTPRTPQARSCRPCFTVSSPGSRAWRRSRLRPPSRH